MLRATLVVPCYNEGQRLDIAAFEGLLGDAQAAHCTLKLLFVDDGSTDDTVSAIRNVQRSAPDRVQLLSLPHNMGKAEAVRRGLNDALATGADVVGYFDADLATPPEEILRLLGVMAASPAHVLLASRVALLGRVIERNPVRHYLGRVFATAASLTLRIAVYDTQCGAKLFRSTPQLARAVSSPFLSRWVFDVELLGRLLVGEGDVPGLPVDAIVEEPLLVWRDMAGSKLRAHHMANAAIDIARVALDLRRRRASRSRS